MLSKYEGLWGGVQGVFDDVFGAAFAFQPMLEVKNALPELDPDRAFIPSVIGIPVIDGGEASEGTHETQRSVSIPKFSFQASKFPQGIQRFDRLQRLNGSTQIMNRIYEVSSVGPDPEAIYRLVVELKEVGEVGS